MFMLLAGTVSGWAENFPVGSKLYLNTNQILSEGKSWASDGARFAVCFRTSQGAGDTFVNMTAVSGKSGYYEVTVPEGNWPIIVFARMNGSTSENNWANKYNDTGEQTYNSSKNCFKITGWNNTGSWDENILPSSTNYYLKHPWGGGEWTWKGPLTDNGDGTYSIEEEYGDNGCNYNTSSDNTGAKYIEKNSLTLVGSPTTRDLCTFTFNTNNNSITITKKAVASYTITYNLNGGTNPGGAPTNYDGTSVVTLPTPTYAGHTFEGWYDNESLTGSVITSIPVGASSNKTYWAKWADIASESLPTEKRESGKIMILSKNKEAKAAWLWYDKQAGVGYNMCPIGTYNSKYLSYYDNVLAFTNCLPLENSVTDGANAWVSSWVKLTSNASGNGSGDVIIDKDLVDKDPGKSPYTDNIMFFEFNGPKKEDVGENAGKFSPFTHIGAKSTLLEETVTVGESVKIITPEPDIVGTLKDGYILSYYLVDGENNVTALESDEFSAPTTPGEYTVYAYIEDPYHFELQKTGEMPLIVNAETYTVTYAPGGATSGSVPTDSKKYKQGETAIVLGNTGALAKKDHNFNGWSDETNNTYSVGSSITVNSNITLTAQWVAQAVASINASHPSGTNFTVATDVTFSVDKASSATISIKGETHDITINEDNAGSYPYSVEDDCTITITAESTEGVVTTRTFIYTVGNVDGEAYYLVSPTLTNGKKLESYKFSNVLYRNGTHSVDQNLLTLTMSDFLMRKMSADGTEEYPDDETIDYWVEKGDGTVVFYPKGGIKTGSNNYPGFNDSGVKYVYVSNVRFKGDHQMYISVNGGDYQKMTYVADAKANGEGGLWCYRLGTDDSYNIVINDYGIAAGVPQTDLKTRTTSTINNSKLIRLADYGNYGHDYEWYSNVTVNNAPAEDTEVIPAANFALGSVNNNMFDAGHKVNDPSTHTYVYTKTQTEAYPHSCNETKESTAVPSTHFTLAKKAEQKSYTWYLNVGNNSYENAQHFTIPAKGVAIAINNTVGDALHAIKELPTNSNYSYSVIGNTTKGSSNWESPSTSKLEMQRTAFYKDSNGDVRTKVLLTDGDLSEVSAQCDSIVYLVTITKPSDAETWPALYMGFAPEVTINKYQNVDKWYQCAIRPQVFRDKDANIHYGGLEWTGVLGADGYENTIGKQTDQTITPQNIDQFTSFVLHMNVTNATYWIAYSGETANQDDGFFICGPAVADEGYENWTKTIKGENPDKTPNDDIKGNAVRMTYDPATESYVATLKLTKNKKFRFLDTSWDKAYYQEDAVLPASDGELGNTKWQSARTWETDYFNNTSLGQSFNVANEGAIDFNLDTDTYTVRFYSKKIKSIVDGKTTYDATPYYTIDYHIGVVDATAGTDLSTGAGSTFSYHKTWSSRLAYLNDQNDPLDVYYVKNWTWDTDPDTKIAKATVTFGYKDNPAYIAPDVPVVLVGNVESTNKSKTYVIVPGDPYGVQEAIQDCKPTVHDIVRCVYETENYESYMNSEKYSSTWNQWSTTVGPGNYDKNNNKYTTRNFIFGRIVPTWRNDGKKELNFWRMKSTNSKMTGHKFLVVASVPDDTKDLESGATFGSYESGAKAQSMANYMTFCLDDEELVTDIQNVESKEVVVENSRIYNLMGIEVKTPIRGQVYIINGRKTIMK